ncbi:hypothetical protein OPQ81_003817 [Rhizoctonia solani]|nr:hypothetical protein OPQ81_003817 [Rhizoctonia solani]
MTRRKNISDSRPSLLAFLSQIQSSYLMRPGERLAVLLPKSLWKPDNMTDECDTPYCKTKFSLFERRHHCRKCGDVFCQACSSRWTLLLDTTNLPFFYLPADVSYTDGPPGPMVNSRVCEACYALIYGYPTTSFMALQGPRGSALVPFPSSNSASLSSIPFFPVPTRSCTRSNQPSEQSGMGRNSSHQRQSSSSSMHSISFSSHSTRTSSARERLGDP